MCVDSWQCCANNKLFLWIAPKPLFSFCGKWGLNSVPSKRALGLLLSSQYTVSQDKKPALAANHCHL